MTKIVECILLIFFTLTNSKTNNNKINSFCFDNFSHFAEQLKPLKANG